MSPFLLWRSAACKHGDRRGGERRMDVQHQMSWRDLLSEAAHKHVSTQVVQQRAWSLEHEPDLTQETPPISAREEAVSMSIMFDAHPTLSIANENRKVDEVARVIGLGVGGPLQKAHAAAIGIVAALVDVLNEGFPDEVGGEQRNATGAA